MELGNSIQFKSYNILIDYLNDILMNIKSFSHKTIQRIYIMIFVIFEKGSGIKVLKFYSITLNRLGRIEKNVKRL